jgi:thioesterase domain-containing protein
MADRYLEQILPHQPTGSIQLIGWSMGGLIAMEIARRMLQANIQVEPLILLDTHLSLSDPSLQEITEESILKLIAPKVGIALRDIRHLPIDRQWDNVLQASQEMLGVDPSDTGVEEIRALAKMCKAHLLAIGNYVPQSVDLEAIMLKASKPWRVSDPRWRTLTKGFRSITVHGTHYSMLAQPDVEEVARKIETLLASRVVHYQAER